MSVWRETTTVVRMLTALTHLNSFVVFVEMALWEMEMSAQVSRLYYFQLVCVNF